jgi:hypothetical protein
MEDIDETPGSRDRCLSGESDLSADSSDELDLWGTTLELDFYFKPNLDIQSNGQYNVIPFQLMRDRRSIANENSSTQHASTATLHHHHHLLSKQCLFTHWNFSYPNTITYQTLHPTRKHQQIAIHCLRRISHPHRCSPRNPRTQSVPSHSLTTRPGKQTAPSQYTPQFTCIVSFDRNGRSRCELPTIRPAGESENTVLSDKGKD